MRCLKSIHQLELVSCPSVRPVDAGATQTLPHSHGTSAMLSLYGHGPGFWAAGRPRGRRRHQPMKLVSPVFLLASAVYRSRPERVAGYTGQEGWALPEERPPGELVSDHSTGSVGREFPDAAAFLGTQYALTCRPCVFQNRGRGWAAVSRPVVYPTVRSAPPSLSRKRACISDPVNSAVRHTLLLLELPARALSCCLVGHSLPASRRRAALGPDPGLVTKPSR